MKLVLKTPYNPGQNDPGATYPELFITQLTDNRGTGNFQFIFEAGQFVTSDDSVTPMWQKGPGMLSQIAQVSGDDYTDAIAAPTIIDTDTPYKAIYRILYSTLIDKGFAGEIVDT